MCVCGTDECVYVRERVRVCGCGKRVCACVRFCEMQQIYLYMHEYQIYLHMHECTHTHTLSLSLSLSHTQVCMDSLGCSHNRECVCGFFCLGQNKIGRRPPKVSSLVNVLEEMTAYLTSEKLYQVEEQIRVSRYQDESIDRSYTRKKTYSRTQETSKHAKKTSPLEVWGQW